MASLKAPLALHPNNQAKLQAKKDAVIDANSPPALKILPEDHEEEEPEIDPELEALLERRPELVAQMGFVAGARSKKLADQMFDQIQGRLDGYFQYCKNNGLVARTFNLPALQEARKGKGAPRLTKEEADEIETTLIQELSDAGKEGVPSARIIELSRGKLAAMKLRIANKGTWEIYSDGKKRGATYWIRRAGSAAGARKKK